MPYRGSKATRPGPVDPLSWKELEQPAGGVKVVVRGSHEVTVPSSVCGAIVVGGILARRPVDHGPESLLERAQRRCGVEVQTRDIAGLGVSFSKGAPSLFAT